MVAKFVILAFFAVAMAQDLGPNRGRETKKALFRLREMASGAERGVNGCLREIEYKRAALETKAKSFLETEKNIARESRGNILTAVGETNKKAYETGAPTATYHCIYQKERWYSSKIADLGIKFETDINILQKTKLDSIDTASKPLTGIKGGFEEIYETKANEVRNCRNSICVRKVLDRARRDYDVLGAEYRKITSQVLTAYSEFARDARNMLSDLEKSANIIAGEGMRYVKGCINVRS